MKIHGDTDVCDNSLRLHSENSTGHAMLSCCIVYWEEREEKMEVNSP